MIITYYFSCALYYFESVKFYGKSATVEKFTEVLVSVTKITGFLPVTQWKFTNFSVNF